MIISTLSRNVFPKWRNEILKTFRSLVGPIKVMPGCISCRFFQDMENDNIFFFLEEWETLEDMDRHIRSQEYRKILALMEMSYEPPEIKFNETSYTAGIEVIEAVRNKEETSPAQKIGVKTSI